MVEKMRDRSRVPNTGMSIRKGGMMTAASAPELANLHDEVLREIAVRGQLRKFQKSAVIIQEGDAGDSLYIILSGKVKVYASDEDGREVTIEIFGPGEYVGEMVLDGGMRSASVMTLEPSLFSVLTRNELSEHIAQHPDFAIHLISRLIKRTRNATNNIKTLALMDVYGRVARFLLGLAVEQDGKLLVPEKLTHQEIAERVGSSREMITRILGDLSRGGYIEVHDRMITMNRRPPTHW
jgi:CRP/FNR family cyclic AMP-dependent transcriptional regulator